VKFKKGDTVIYPQHGACKVEAIRKEDPLNTGKQQEYLVLRTVIGDMTLRVPMSKVDEVGVRPPVSPDELEDLVAVLAKADPRVPSNWSRRFKNHQEKLKSGDVYQVAEVSVTSQRVTATHRCQQPSAPCTSGPVSTSSPKLLRL